MRFLMKAAGVLLITAGACLNGISLSKQYRQRVNALEHSLAVLTTLILRLKATLAPPSELISGFCCEFDSPPDYVVGAEKLLHEFEFDSAWEKAVWQSGLALNQSDRRLICRFGEDEKLSLRLWDGIATVADNEVSVLASRAEEV